jgi:hypothetical protein
VLKPHQLRLGWWEAVGVIQATLAERNDAAAAAADLRAQVIHRRADTVHRRRVERVDARRRPETNATPAAVRCQGEGAARVCERGAWNNRSRDASHGCEAHLLAPVALERLVR